MTWPKNVILAVFFILVFLSGCIQPGNGTTEKCFSLEEVQTAFEREGKCLVIFQSEVFDLTAVSDWTIGMHKGAHNCGEEFIVEEIEQGLHGKEVLNPFRVGKICK